LIRVFVRTPPRPRQQPIGRGLMHMICYSWVCGLGSRVGKKLNPGTWAARKALHQDLVWVPRMVLAPAFQLSVEIAHTQPNWLAATCVGD
jgi:hypothetical protein